MKRAAAGVIAAIALLVGCSGDDYKLTEGTVVDKAYNPPEMIMMPTMCGKISCLIPIHEPAHWYLTIEGEHDRETVTETHEVSSGTYERFDVGDYWRDEG